MAIRETRDPGVNDDSTLGYTVGQVWINDSVTPRRVWELLDGTGAAAMWGRVGHLTVAGEIVTLTAKATPVANDYLLIEDSESVGPINQKKRSTIGAVTAVGGGGTIVPDLLAALGTFGAWTGESQPGNGVVRYVRIFLFAGTYTGIETVLTAIQTGRTLDMGVYADDGGSPTPSPTGARLASTGAILVDGAANTVFRQPFTASLVVATPAYYWMALLTNSPSLRVASTPGQFNLAWRSRLYASQAGAGATLPNPVGALDAPAASAVPYMGIVRA